MVTVWVNAGTHLLQDAETQANTTIVISLLFMRWCYIVTCLCIFLSSFFGSVRNHFLSTLSGYSEPIVHIGSGVSATSYIVETASSFYGVQVGSW